MTILSFCKPVPALLLAIAAYLGMAMAWAAAMIKAPNQFHPVRHPHAHAQRVARIRALPAGACKPGGWFDTSFDACDPVTLAQPH